MDSGGGIDPNRAPTPLAIVLIIICLVVIFFGAPIIPARCTDALVTVSAYVSSIIYNHARC